MKKPKVTVFTTNYCASCQTLKRWLDSKTVAYDVVNLDEEPERQMEILEKTGQLQVPVTLIEASKDKEDVVVGTQYSQISRALNLNGA